MGMYDSVIFQCPVCEGDIEIQSKSGDCLLKRFDCGEVPVEIANSMITEFGYCEKCDRSFKVRASRPLPKITFALELENE